MLYRDYAKDKYQNAFHISNAEGVPCVLKGSKGKKIRNYELYGNSVQDGTPSPESPVEIQSVGDLTTKNLLPNDWELGFISVSSGANQDGLAYVRTKDYFTFDISKNYYISSDSIDTRTTISWYFYDENKNFISRFVSYKNRTIGTSGCAVTIPTNTVFFRLAVLTTDINIKVQIEEGSTATEYEPYHKYDIPITVTGKNLLHSSATISTMKGVTMTYDNGVIMLNGTCTASANFELCKIALSANTYTLSANANKVPVNNDYAFVQLYDSTNNQIIEVINSNAQGYKTITTSVDGNFKYRVRIDAGCVYDNVILKPQLELGSSATSYEPYKGSETKHIYLDEPLRKIGDYADYIDFKNQKVVRNVEVLDDTGTKTISESFGTLATPTEESIALPALKTFKDTNLISVDSTISSSNIKAKYIKK